MQFNCIALDNKKKYLDIILSDTATMKKVLNRNIKGIWTIENIPRVWEPGGGSTLYLLEVEGKKYILKIKHRSVTVESKLEEETDFMQESSLEHEKNMIQIVEGDFIPEILFWDEEDENQFLAMEYIDFSLLEYLSKISINEMFDTWDKLESCVRELFDAGIVHCDLHEHNIRCRSNGDIVLIDFEESRILKQTTAFKESLDYIGENDNSKLGEFPLWKKDGNCTIKYNCLKRVKEVFKEHILSFLPGIVRECNYDSTNGICTALDHGISDKVYQSIDTKYIKVEGQRPLNDRRISIVREICGVLFKEKNFTFIDIGSNNGNFCRAISEYTNNLGRCIGLEGFSKFNILARTLAFLEDNDNIDFRDFVCGEDDFESIFITHPCIVNVCSVWHHIQSKDVFLKQIRNQRVDYIFLELATQSECYQGHTWQEELDTIVEKLGFQTKEILMFSKDYKRPLILIAKENIDPTILNKLKENIKVG